MLNERGQQFGLNDRNCFLENPSGLGMESELQFMLIGDTFRKSRKTMKQQTFEGTLNFMKPNQYEKYKRFMDFILCSRELELVYEIAEREQYLRKVEFADIKKEEIKDGDILSCPVTMYFTTLFYKKNQEKYIIKSDAKGMTYPYRLPVRYDDSSNFEIGFNNNGHVDASIMFEYYGPAEEPVIDIYDNEMNLIFSLKLTERLEKNEILKYSSVDDDLYISKTKDNGEEINIINEYTDLSKPLFFKIPLGFHTIKFRKNDILNSHVILHTLRYYKVV